MSHIEPRRSTILGRTKMRTKLVKIVVILLLSGLGDSRPQKTESLQPQTTKVNAEERKSAQVSSTPKNIREDSSAQPNDPQRHLKDLQYIDQSLRTVATQLLNVSNPEETGKILDNNIINKSNSQKLAERNDVLPMKEITVNNGQSMSFGRPINSKFGYFETSHPGQAMAITEEELEREMSSTRLMTAYKNHPTTTGGISTWILLNPPSTTIKTTEAEKKVKQPLETETRTTIKPTTLMERVETTERVIERITMPVSTTATLEEPASTKKVILTTKKTTETNSEKTQSIDKAESPQNTTSKYSQTTGNNFESKDTSVSPTKKIHTVRTTPKPKTATSKTTLLSKPSITKTSRPNQQARPKPLIRRTTVKPDNLKNENNSTAKIEKVTFRPVQMITIPKSKLESTEKPMFVTKIKASVLMDTQKTTVQPPLSSTTYFATTSKSTSFNSDLVEIPAKIKHPVATKNNVLKAQLKKPLDDTKIEIEPIKVNAPVLKIEKVEKVDPKEEETNKETENLNSSKIDLKFDFNPELTKINVDTDSSTSSTTPTSTLSTKRPRHSSKRKKNKSRRRKPSTPMVTTTVPSVISSSTEMELMAEEAIVENGIQESKIAPETKLVANSTKTKKKPVQKPISTQIYNFLSREVMPSFGMMSLVGLGLGLASYFLYPFGGTIARRNYEIEPKYKYNLDEYGGNYGQSEEEVLSKVLQGMITDESKYPGIKDYDNNYYQYQHYDGGYEPQTTKKYEQRFGGSSSPMYRPENTASGLKYRNTDYRYADAPSTANYYEKPKNSDYVVGQSVAGSANRQFVVGNVPKEYPPYEEKIPALSTSGKLSNSYAPTESGQAQFDRDVGQNYNFPGSSVQSYGQVQTARPDDGYEEVEITPTAVAVEHGPRSLKRESFPDSIGSPSMEKLRSRKKRDSVIQIIPTKRELEEEEKEEDLSNEILNIIDLALPGEKDEKNRTQDNEVEDFEAQRRKQKEEEKTRFKESTTKVSTAETSTPTSVETSTRESVSSATKEATDSSTSSSVSSVSSEIDHEVNPTESSMTSEQSNVEWIDLTTKQPPEQQDGFNIFSVVKKIAEIKFRLGLTLLKHASEGFARYLGHVQKRINGEE
ncbi:uncharacterized protein LOC122396850 isoform X1 [Colletes gigas]|uniref:uncharacterized protein LOC122396850 isoform X1 n=2 Tax=Colletes gigas TaxID=935657 RepID=UPI001C9A7EEB|nr:uncharacterized protein LOC122396850 isoform X1 [Colletes gigas]